MFIALVFAVCAGREPEKSLVLPLWDLEFHVCKEEAIVRAVLLAAAIGFPAMANGHQGTVEQDEGQRAAV